MSSFQFNLKHWGKSQKLLPVGSCCGSRESSCAGLVTTKLSLRTISLGLTWGCTPDPVFCLGPAGAELPRQAAAASTCTCTQAALTVKEIGLPKDKQSQPSLQMRSEGQRQLQV